VTTVECTDGEARLCTLLLGSYKSSQKCPRILGQTGCKSSPKCPRRRAPAQPGCEGLATFVVNTPWIGFLSKDPWTIETLHSRPPCPRPLCGPPLLPPPSTHTALAPSAALRTRLVGTADSHRAALSAQRRPVLLDAFVFSSHLSHKPTALAPSAALRTRLVGTADSHKAALSAQRRPVLLCAHLFSSHFIQKQRRSRPAPPTNRPKNVQGSLDKPPANRPQNVQEGEHLASPGVKGWPLLS